MGFSKKKFVIFLKTANDVKVVLGCNWNSRFSQKVEELAPSWEKRFVFRRKNRNFLKTAKDSKFAGECNWISKVSQDVQNSGFLFEKNRWVFGKIVFFFKKNPQVAILHYNATEIVNLKTFQNSVL